MNFGARAPGPPHFLLERQLAHARQEHFMLF
jgi:hypothetical protein